MSLAGSQIGELAENHAASLFGEFVGRIKGSLHALRAGREHNLGAKSGYEFAALDAHGFRHGQNGLESHGPGGQGDADAHVAAGGLKNGAPGLQGAVAESAADEVQGHTVLDGAAGIAAFELHENVAGQIGVQGREMQQRGIADAFENRIQHGRFLLLRPAGRPRMRAVRSGCVISFPIAPKQGTR